MNESIELVREIALALPYQDRLQLMHLLLDDMNNELEDLTENEMEKIEEVLRERLDGPFETIEDVKAWTTEILERFEA